MRLVSPYTVLVFVVIWTVVFLLAARNFLFSAHQVRLFRHRRMSRCNGCRCLPLPQSWFEEEEHKFVQELEVKLENLDARDMRQLNELYAEMKRVEGELIQPSGVASPW